MLSQLDVSTGQKREVSIKDAAVIRDFYTVVLPDGSRTDAWEQWLGEVESDIAPALKRAVDIPNFHVTDRDRHHLARWIALQFLRGPANRRQMAEIASFTVRAQVGMGGVAYLQHVMSKGLGRDVSLAEVEQVWADITSDGGPEIKIAGDEHLEILMRTIEKATSEVYARSWGRISFKRQHLAVSDSPVGLVRGDTPDWLGVGLISASALTVPLDRQTLLWLSLPTGDGALDDRDLEPSAYLARAHNEASFFGAERFVYFHPDDDLIPSTVHIPRGSQRLEISGGTDFVNRDRPLADVLEQIANHRNPSGEDLIADYNWPIPGYHPRDA
jgi:hypothetical protein